MLPRSCAASPRRSSWRSRPSAALGKSPYPQKAYPAEPGQLEYSYAIDTEKFKYITLKLCVDAGVDVLFHTYFCQSNC